MSRNESRKQVEAVGITSAGTVHFIRTENGSPKTDNEIKNIGGKATIVEGYRTFCGKLIDKDNVFIDNADEKVDEFVERGKHFCKSCRSNVRFHRDDIERT